MSVTDILRLIIILVGFTIHYLKLRQKLIKSIFQFQTEDNLLVKGDVKFYG